MESAANPSVLFVYYTYTQQTRKAIDVMAEELRGRGCDVHLGPIEFTDPRYERRFKVFPMPHPFREVLGMLPVELRRGTGAINIPDVVTEREYDLVCIGAPTWWLSTNVPIRSFLMSETAGRALNGIRFAVIVPCRRYWKHNLKTIRRIGTKLGGEYVDGIHFRYEGGQVRSLLSLISYLGSGANRDKYFGVKIPPTNLRDYHLRQARAFAGRLADRLSPTGTAKETP
jgi:menaquinone-dependent protoporphyrinogen IX oxidase